MSNPTFVAIAGVLGACVGSFLNVVIYRLPHHRSLGGRSHCPLCGAAIPFRWNLPVLGWLLLGGRTRCCKKRYSVRYPLVEALTAALFVAVALAPPFAPLFLEDGRLAGQAVHGALWHCVFLSLLVANTFIDADHRILPDALTIPGMVVGVLAALLVPGLPGLLGTGDNGVLDSATASLVGIIVGAGTTAAIRTLAGKVFRREAMGFGDVKFMGMIGAFLGWKGALLSMFLGCVLGAVIGVARLRASRDAMIPFGPFLAMGAALSLFWREELVHFLFETWPEWQQNSAAAPWILSGFALLSLVALMVLVRRGRGHG